MRKVWKYLPLNTQYLRTKKISWTDLMLVLNIINIHFFSEDYIMGIQTTQLEYKKFLTVKALQDKQVKKAIKRIDTTGKVIEIRQKVNQDKLFSISLQLKTVKKAIVEGNLEEVQWILAETNKVMDDVDEEHELLSDMAEKALKDNQNIEKMDLEIRKQVSVRLLLLIGRKCY